MRSGRSRFRMQGSSADPTKAKPTAGLEGQPKHPVRAVVASGQPWVARIHRIAFVLEPTTHELVGGRPVVADTEVDGAGGADGGRVDGELLGTRELDRHRRRRRRRR